MSNADQYVIDVVDKTLDLIEYLGTADGTPGVTEIAQELDISRARVFRILKTLERKGYVASDPDTRGYYLSLKFLQIGKWVRQRIKLRDVAEAFLVKLARKTGDVTLLMVLMGDHAFTVDTYRGSQRLQVEVPIGIPKPLHIGAAPKVLLAYLPNEDRERYIRDAELTGYTAHTITDQDELRDCLNEIRRQGYVIAEEDYYLGEYSIAVPVRDDSEQVVGAISVTAPCDRDSPERREDLIALLLAAADGISRRLGYGLA
jgi:DNA-binding IclR family transcriptional regulator